MRQHHVAGDKVSVDYSGKRVEIVSPETSDIRRGGDLAQSSAA